MSNVAPPAAGRTHEFTTKSGADTVEVGRKLVRLLAPPQLMILRGDLGTGKTTLVKGIAQALDAAEPDEVTSPTFSLIHEYDGELDGKPVKLFHLDVYRLEGERQLESLGLDELLTPDALVLVEWGEKFKSIRKKSDRRNCDHRHGRRCAQDYRDAEGLDAASQQVSELAARAAGVFAELASLRYFIGIVRTPCDPMTRISFDEVQETLAGVLGKLGFSIDRAQKCARLFAETTCDGVYTHGINRFPRMVAMVRNGSIDVAAEPRRVAGFGALERWDGRKGPGNLNAQACMERALALSREHGVGFVTLGNTNHWMRGGTYGWQAAEAGLIGICWTNTQPNLPAWGGVEPCVGNNPLVIAVPRASGHVVLDMAMSQFSYGALESYRKRGEKLPVDGGFDKEAT